MKAWIVDGGFGLDQLVQVERPLPEPGRGQVRVRLSAASINYRDLLMVTGGYDPRQPLPLVPLSDGVGRIDAIGADVRGWAVGDWVCPTFVQGWLDGDIDPRLMRRTLGGPIDGCLQEAIVCDADGLVRPPEHLDDTEAACLPCAGVTAWRCLEEAGIRAGDTVLALGTGGVSTFALQLARLRGARVVVTSSRADKLERALALGADHGIRYDLDPSWGKAVRAWTGGRGVDLVVEVGGAGTLDQSLRAVRAGGTIALLGVLDGVTANVALTRVFMNGVRLQGVLVGHRADFEALCRALAAHPEVRPVVDRVVPFDEAPQALRHLQSQTHLGKVVVRVGAS